MQEQAIHWKSGANTRIPYGLYVDEQTRAREEERIFRGAVWNYLCLDIELPQPGSSMSRHR